ncbi:DUF3237 domain-containing protein [Peribacillus butanolivorans]|uniref:DUF3237 domain-containing protein n=1 Tax=Peribacillus butanolivorans TaxID=421767 RepID=UPI0030C8F757
MNTRIGGNLKLAHGLEFFMEAKVLTGSDVQELGVTQKGKRRVIPILGGTFEGPNIKGIVVPGGADWQLIRSDGVKEIEARYTLQTDDGHLIYVENRGIIYDPEQAIEKLKRGEYMPPETYYFRTTPTFEVSGERYVMLTRTFYVGVGEPNPTGVHIKFYKLT